MGAVQEHEAKPSALGLLTIQMLASQYSTALPPPLALELTGDVKMKCFWGSQLPAASTQSQAVSLALLDKS